MLLNIAGVDFEGMFSERSARSVTAIVRLNIEATLRVTHGALASRAPEQPFYIVFVSSHASFYPIPLKATYAASKSFLREFAFALGKEMEREGVRVLTLCPGGLATTPEALSGITAQGFWGNVNDEPARDGDRDDAQPRAPREDDVRARPRQQDVPISGRARAEAGGRRHHLCALAGRAEAVANFIY
jgi:NAD(P)-dependent dehydrogenase (short-subunit alcohol dehydrogenase family)